MEKKKILIVEDELFQAHDMKNVMGNLFNYANVPIMVWGPDFKITQFNQALEHFTGYMDYDVVGQGLGMLFSDKTREESMEKIKATSSGELWESVEIPIFCKDRSTRLALWNSANIYTKDGTTLIATIAQGQDITDRKLAEDQVKTSLVEKELLLKEIHHRVKNDMQIINSLLSLQCKYITDKKTLKSFQDTSNRVLAMALVNEELYSSGDFLRISISHYIGSITKQLFDTYNINPEMVTLKTSIEDVLLGIDMAIPCGLLISELISNALKHAFPDGRKGEITIDLYQDKDFLHLTLRDNGVGMPREVNFDDPETFGLLLINILAKQLDVDITFERDKGTTVKVGFKVKEQPDRMAPPKEQAE